MGNNSKFNFSSLETSWKHTLDLLLLPIHGATDQSENPAMIDTHTKKPFFRFDPDNMWKQSQNQRLAYKLVDITIVNVPTVRNTTEAEKHKPYYI